MAKSFKELQNENKAITKQLSKCAVNESIISKNYKKLNTMGFGNCLTLSSPKL